MPGKTGGCKASNAITAALKKKPMVMTSKTEAECAEECWEDWNCQAA